MKVSIVGIGHVGSALAFVLTLKNIVKELVLVGRTRESAKGDVLDLRHGQLFVDTPAQVTAGTLVDTAGSDIIAMCASIPTPKDMRSRLELARGNVELMRQLMPELARLSPGCKVVMVSNPVDVLVHYALEFTGFRPHQVIGTGTLVDSARFRQLLAEELRIHSGDIRAYILGEHGDSQFPAMSCAGAGGEPLDPTPGRYRLFEKASKAGFEVLKHKGCTNYAVALAAAEIIECIITDAKHTMPVSLRVDGFLGVRDVCLSLPAVVGGNGIERVLHPRLNEQEQAAFLHSAQVVRDAIAASRPG
ncbi:malate dehydrogenase [Marinobacter lutaoensis]|jgi:L-lactate dehydrogenase|uniref:Lactate dehydrogenase n=1 Tax=Marinobacter lutaoensis TaxID=135739 RepID=A0A1V2DRQ6_9GAMM|nr:lactate/malate dehydrogenase family protein [Marinobacter lutaoensis]NVD36716.1 lactate/malate dehydrogenase family protein [Marinobacter lutaoensis]ONF43021.1 lactate dehydrogenase [Marinobacter lutaoensis]